LAEVIKIHETVTSLGVDAATGQLTDSDENKVSIPLVIN